MSLGLIHIYTGDGKGKSTAACGLAVRAFGAGLRVQIVRFLKSEQSGECKAIAMLQAIDRRIETVCFETSHKFLWDMTEPEKKVLQEQVREAYQYCFRVAREHLCDLLVMDEAIGAVHAGFLKEEDLLRLMQEKNPHVELVLTGRNAPECLVEKADYVSEIRAVKHPFDRGISAREGIEF